MPSRAIKDIAWLAGLLEGEGSFRVDDNGTKACIKIGMVDYDVIFKVRSLIDPSKVISEDCNKAKNFYVYQVYGKTAIQWMMTLYPLMGNRRQRKIKEIIHLWRLYKKKARLGDVGDRCRRKHLIIGFNAIPSGMGGHKCRLCATGKKRDRDIALRIRLIEYLKKKDSEHVSRKVC